MIKTKIENKKEIKAFMNELNIDNKTATWLLFKQLNTFIPCFKDLSAKKHLIERLADLVPIIITIEEVNLYEVKNTKLQKLLKAFDTISNSI